jgi:hypothetical protein
MTNIFNPDFTDFLELLIKNKVEYLLVGGYSVILHGYIRSTGDMDLWVNKSQDNYLKIKKTYIEFGAPVFPENDFPENEFNVWGIGVEPSKILTHIDGLTFDESMKKCNFFKLEKINVPYINFNDLIKNKLSSGRFKDLADIEQLNKLKKNSND